MVTFRLPVPEDLLDIKSRDVSRRDLKFIIRVSRGEIAIDPVSNAISLASDFYCLGDSHRRIFMDDYMAVKREDRFGSGGKRRRVKKEK